MQSHPGKLIFKLKKEENDTIGSSVPGHMNGIHQKPVDLSSSSTCHDTEDGDDLSNDNACKQLVLYEPVTDGTREIAEPIQYHRQPFPEHTAPNLAPRVLPSVGAFTVQCANCFKWRIIPTKRKYEAIREHILEEPFYCETATEWRPDISCDEPADITQDGSRLWAIDKPNIAQPPPGWERLLRIRCEGSSKFADVYYQAPSGKKLRSMVEVQKYLLDHPEYMSDGVSMSKFSFQIPKPLQENYVRKRPRLTATYDGSSPGMSRPLELCEADPLGWARPNDNTGVELGRLALPPPYFEAPVFDPVCSPAKKKGKKTLLE